MEELAELIEAAIEEGDDISSIARDADVSRQAIYDILSGTVPTIPVARRIAERLGHGLILRFPRRAPK